MLVYILFLAVIFILLLYDKYFLVSNKKIGNINESVDKNRKSNISYQQKKFTVPMVLVIIIIYVFSAFRFDVGWDYINYYHTIKFDAVTNIVTLQEYGTIFLIELAKKTEISNLYFALNSFITIFLIMKTIKAYSSDYWISIIFFICFPLFYLNSLSVIRMFTAVSITFYGFKYIEHKEFSKYLLTTIIAGLFHKTAFITIIFYFVIHYIKRSSTNFVILLTILFGANFFLKNMIMYLFPRYIVYFNETDTQEGTKAIFVFIIIGIFSFFYKKKIFKTNVNTTFYYQLFFLGLTIYLAFFNMGTLGHRLSLYGTIYSILLLPDIISIVKRGLNRILIKYLIYISCIAMFLYTVYIGAVTYIPYKTIFSIK